VRTLIRPATSIADLKWVNHKNVEFFRADLRSRGRLEELVAGVDAVLHLAVSQASVADTVLGTENLLDAMRKAKIDRIVLVSSFSVYNYIKLRTWSELTELCAVEAEPEKRDNYCLAKLMQENLVCAAAAEYGLRFTILRPGAIFGKGHVWTARLGIALSDRVWIRLGAWAKLPLSYVENCAEAVVMSAEKDEAVGKTFNVIDDETPTQRFYSRQLQRNLSPSPCVIPVPWTVVRIIARMAQTTNKILFHGHARLPHIFKPTSVHARCKPLRYTNRKIKETIGWRPRYSLAEALDRCFDAKV
jgi:nucleoside-diphosphate-sugar epimerase